MTVCPLGGSVKSETVIVCPLVVTFPTVADVQPGESDVTGAVQPGGTAIFSKPLWTPSPGAVYVNAIVFPAVATATSVVAVVTVPTSAGGSAIHDPKTTSHCGCPASRLASRLPPVLRTSRRAEPAAEPCARRIVVPAPM